MFSVVAVILFQDWLQSGGPIRWTSVYSPESSWNYKGCGETCWKFHCVEFRQAGLHRLGGKLQLPDTAVFWDTMPRSWLLRCKILQQRVYVETSVHVYQTSRRHIPDDSLYCYRREIYLRHFPM